MLFSLKYSLKGHEGPVHSVKFPPNGGPLLASSSFDRSVRLWNMDNKKQPERSKLLGHESCVSSVCWSPDSRQLASSSYDKTVALWDVELGQEVFSGSLPGFGLEVAYEPGVGNLVFVAASNKIAVFDPRSGAKKPAATIEHGSVVNTIMPYRGVPELLSGGTDGVVRTWDLRSTRYECLSELPNGPAGRPISHITCPQGAVESLTVAVNSYSNETRVYDRGVEHMNDLRGALHLRHVLKGPRFSQWPIRCALFEGAQHSSVRARSRDVMEAPPRQPSSVDESLLLATGSTDNLVYLFDISGQEGSSRLLQTLEGHHDKVYATAFHPTRPVLASAGADFNIRVWGAKY